MDSVRGVAATVLIAAAVGAAWWQFGAQVKQPTVDRGATVTTVPAQSAATANRGPAAPAPAEAPGRVAQGRVIEIAPPAEEAPAASASPEHSISAGRRAGLHTVRDDLNLSSSAAVVVDQSTGQILLRKNAEAVLPIASLTKLMTALVVSEARLPLDEAITITQEDVDDERRSRSRLRVGTALKRGEALHVALMSSENRAAHALGRTFPGGLENFMRAMNRKAKLLGMGNTVFVDPTGLSSHNLSTAQDLATLASVAAKDPLVAGYTTSTEHLLAVAGGRMVQYRNSNRLVKNPQWDISLQKTGYIIEAGWCMVIDAKVVGQDLLIVLLDAAGNGSRFADAERIRRWVAEQTGYVISNAAPVVVRKAQAKSRQRDVRKARSRLPSAAAPPAARPGARATSPRHRAEKCRSPRNPCRPARSGGNAG